MTATSDTHTHASEGQDPAVADDTVGLPSPALALDGLPAVPLHVYIDLVCPWCYIGKRRLDEAVRQFEAEGGSVEISYLPFQLDPDAPDEPRDLMPSLEAKFGGAQQAAAAMTHITEIAVAEGLEYDFDGAIAVNTMRAHRLLFAAGKQGQAVQSALAEALMDAHLCRGQDISDTEVLTALANDVGLMLDVPAYLASGTNEDVVRQLDDEARQAGISSVPTYVFAGRWGVSGAQESDTIATVLRQVALNLSGAAGGGCGCGGGGCGCGGGGCGCGDGGCGC